MGADYSFEVISIVHWVPKFIGHNKIFLGSVCRKQLQLSQHDLQAHVWMFIMKQQPKVRKTTSLMCHARNLVWYHFLDKDQNYGGLDRSKFKSQDSLK